MHRNPNRGILGYGSSTLYTNEVTRAYQKSEIASVKLGKFSLATAEKINGEIKFERNVLRCHSWWFQVNQVMALKNL